MLAKNIKVMIVVACIVGGTLCATLIPFLMSSLNNSPQNRTITLNQSSQVSLTSDPPLETDLQEPQIPNITETLNCIDGFVAENLTAYVGAEVIPDFGQLKHVRIVLDWIYIYDDHDFFDAGDIYLELYSMIYSVGQALEVDHQIFNRIFIGYLNDYDNYTTDIVLFDGWVWHSSIIIRIFDEDPAAPDELLGYYWRFTDSAWSYQGDLIYDLSTWGDARIRIYQQVLETRPTTASDVVNLMRPYLFTDVETSEGLNLDKVYGRVVYGYDTLLHRNTYCIQYYFYWAEEYTCLDSFVHYWDYEPLYYFIDPLTARRPYRIVFDNGFYWSGEPGGDEQWWKCHDYTIYENLTLTGQTTGTKVFNVNFTADLAPLIGYSNQLQFKIKSITEIFDSALSNWVYGIGGFNVPVITVETSYHSFDKGDSDGGLTWAFAYTVGNLTDQLIYSWFARLPTCFTGGTHSVDGVATPWYSPFCYDIMNPFQRPYISNNFDGLLSNILIFNDAKDSDYFSYEIISDVKAHLTVPIDAEIATQSVLAPNQTFNPNVTISIDVSKAILAIDYAFGFSVTVDWWFWEDTYDFIKNGTIYIDFSNPIFQLIGTYIKTINGYFGSFSPTNFLEVEMAFTPQLLGTIFNATITLKILELLYTYLPTLRPFLMFFIDDFDLVINPILEGFLNMDSWITGSAHTPYTFHDLEWRFSPTLTTPTDGSDFTIWIGNFSYGWRFSVDWDLTIDFTSFLNSVINDIYINLFTYPDINLTLLSLSQNVALCSYSWNSRYQTYILD